ncbi:hypothetical protein [Sphingopyxis sp. GW247-27LB]|uniref:hypothetical protein n=1 Tax=Sphingopyxis sp. GW247-27LB TaxID=2012632 RepID=UPI000BA68473|nr:hypothetical protein [Sphingopyxis sp. GW247-27LB]PAL23579.1 hypothetical protein CD928_05795 [Sphingopyxis sp. GW247-27LB]
MTRIYEQHDAAFAQVSAHVILKDGECVATVAMKFGASGRVTAYLHWIGVEMVRGHADGGGYDKASAAVEAAARKLDTDIPGRGTKSKAQNQAHISVFRFSLIQDDGRTWDRCLRDAGFNVLQAV